MSSGRPLIYWTIVAVVTAVLTATTVVHVLGQYRDFRSGWSWDLAYYNQWFWALTQGDGQLSVRPASAYAEEGPSVWKTNYLAPIRLVLVPLYMGYPDPRTLLVIHSVVFWWVVPAAYTLVRSESRSELAAISAAGLVPLTPLLWPLAWNDFRELQMALPFVLWAIQGIRSRSVSLSVTGIALLLACRQEYAVMVATFAFLPSREPEGLTRTLNWRQALLAVGLGWLFFGFFAYLKLMVGRGAPDNFIDQFLGPRASIEETLATSAEMLAYGMGAWALFACLAPRVAILAIPWVWSLCNGRWAVRLLATGEWHHVRYAAPAVAMVLAAGLVGYSRLAAWLAGRRHGRQALALVWILAAAAGGLGMTEVMSRMARVPHPIGLEEVRSIRHWIDQIGPEDGVLATYEVTAPLSSRRRLYSYILEQNKPRGFPQLGSEFRWVFVRKMDFDPMIFRGQGFEVVYTGEFLTIFRRTS
jgi:hypothetical protein